MTTICHRHAVSLPDLSYRHRSYPMGALLRQRRRDEPWSGPGSSSARVAPSPRPSGWPCSPHPGLRKEFSGDPLFDGVSFRLRRGDRLALAGPNGAGKTTLLRALVGETSLQGPASSRSPRTRGCAARPAAASRPGTDPPRVLALGRERPRCDRGGADAGSSSDGRGRPRRRDTSPLQRGTGAARARRWLGLARSRGVDPSRARVPRRRPRPAARHVLRRRAHAGLARPRPLRRPGSAAARRADEPPRRREPRVARARADVARCRDRARRTRPLVPRGGDDRRAGARRAEAVLLRRRRGTPGGARRRRAPPRRRPSSAA